MSFRIETHLHTSESSACGNASAAEQVKQYIANGYNGMLVTDHFVNGNSAVDRSKPWEEQMEKQFSGYFNALKAAENTDFKVFFSTEYAYHGTEFIVIGLDYEWFVSHPEIIEKKPEEFLEIFRSEGAAVIQVHPFRRAPYIKEIRLYPEYVDAIEAFNLANGEYDWNVSAYELAKKYNKPITAGSDCHYIGKLGAGIDLDVVPQNERELADIIRSGKGWKIFGDTRNS